MMIATVQPYGAASPVRLNASAVAYVSACVDGAVVHLVGGERLRVSHGPEEVEQLLGWRDAPPPKVKPKTAKAA